MFWYLLAAVIVLAALMDWWDRSQRREMAENETPSAAEFAYKVRVHMIEVLWELAESRELGTQPVREYVGIPKGSEYADEFARELASQSNGWIVAERLIMFPNGAALPREGSWFQITAYHTAAPKPVQ